MTRLGPYEVHPAAEFFPLLEGEEFDQLVDDIKRHGLREPIVLSRDKTTLIDGRNRYRACEAAGVDAVFRPIGSQYTDAMILDLIVSENVRRRHLNAGQLAMVAADLEPMYAAALKLEEADRKTKPAPWEESQATVADRPQSSSTAADKARDKAARAVGARGRTTSRAKAVQRDAPDLAEKVRTGQMALDAADRERKQRARAEPKPEPTPAGPASITKYTHEGKPVSYPEPKGKATFNETRGDGISWAAWSWNPVTGCLHGCEYCYARELATKPSYSAAYPVGFTPLFHPERLEAPANTTVPGAHRGDPAWKRVFVCSMADLYGRWVPDEWIARVLEACRGTPHWQYLMLTKFPSRYVGLELPSSAWIGTSVDEQKRVRIAEDAFRQIDGVKVKWLSLEPLREPLEFSDLSMFDWVVVGAQTETRQPTGTVSAFAPPFEWVARIVAQAREAGCRIHMKPNLLGKVWPGSPGMQLLNEYPEG